MRINKYLSQNGYCSRREADRLIEAGKVSINGRKAGLGDQVAETDQVRVEGRDRRKPPEPTYILLHKPVGYITTSDRTKPDNIFDIVDIEERVYPVGRLDVQSSGLLLLTNDGILANRLMHPRHEHEKEYVVRVDKAMPRTDIRKLQQGVELDDGPTLPTKVRQMSPNRFAIILKEGRNRQIRRMCAALGYEVKELKRTRVSTLKMPSHYPAGNWRYLTQKEVHDLKKAAGLQSNMPKNKPKKKRG